MIADSLDNLSKYENLVPYLKEIVNYLKNNNLSLLNGGRYEILGNSIFALIQEYHTQPASEKFMESHEKYIDIQIVLDGQEFMGYSPKEFLKIKDPYNEENDIIFYENNLKEESYINVRKNHFCIFFPEDAHKPGLHLSIVRKVRKAVIKVAVK